MIEDFSANIIKEYKYWRILVFSNQSYLGRCVVWCKRDDALDLTDATSEEQTELFSILKDLRVAINKIFKPDWLNYAFLGNETRHLHCHVIPRYSKIVEFMGTTFEDKLYGHNYQTDKNFITPEEVLFKVRDELKNELA